MELGGVRNAADRKVVLDFLETLTTSDGSTTPAASLSAAVARAE
jgi:hypothetical protein